MASFAAALIGAGTSKSGWPMLRLTGSLRLRARSNILRMPEDSMPRMRSAIQRSAAEEGMAGISLENGEFQIEEGRRLLLLILRQEGKTSQSRGGGAAASGEKRGRSGLAPSLPLSLRSAGERMRYILALEKSKWWL